MVKLKILLLNTDDTFHKVLKNAKKLYTRSGPFECVIILTSFSNTIDLKLKYSVNFPTFITSGSNFFGDQSGLHTISDGLNILNRFGIYELSSGLTIGYVIMLEADLVYRKNEVLNLFSERSHIDILITNFWPAAMGIKDGSRYKDILDQIVTAVKPKYHFSNYAPKFIELEPFRWEQDDESYITRFINLANYGSGEKWKYGFKINPGHEEKMYLPNNMISNPYFQPSSKRGNDELVKSSAKKSKIVLPRFCHFCLSNPEVEDHMIVSVSECAYITIAKGPLAVPNGKMNFSGHCLIIPIQHIPKLNYEEFKSTNLLETPIWKDMLKFENSLVEMNYTAFDMSTLVFEINSSNSIHFHKQVLPIPKYLIFKFTTALERQIHLNNERFSSNVKINFQEYNGYDDESFLEIVNDPKANYLQFTVYETFKMKPQIYISVFEKHDRIDLQFGRRVAAFLLKLPRKIMWNSKFCYQTKEEEIIEAERFQLSYKDFDFTK